ncbi:MAG: hypothetical protein U1A78_22410 [Polyangia bacterium]
MDALPARLIAHVFTKEPQPAESLVTLRERLSQVCAEHGAMLLDFVLDHEQPARRLLDYPSLVRIARGEADGLVLTRLPLSFDARRSRDRLCAALVGPLMILTAAELRTRGLLPVRLGRRPRAAASAPAVSSREPEGAEPTPH